MKGLILVLEKLDAAVSFVRTHPFLDFVFDMLAIFGVAGLGAFYALACVVDRDCLVALLSLWDSLPFLR